MTFGNILAATKKKKGNKLGMVLDSFGGNGETVKVCVGISDYDVKCWIQSEKIIQLSADALWHK